MCPTTTKAFQQIFDNDDEMYDTWAPKFKKITNRYAQKVLKATSQAGPATAKQSKLSMLPKGKVPAGTTRSAAATSSSAASTKKKPSSIVSLHSTNSSSSTSGTRQVSRQSSTSASTSNSGRANRYATASLHLVSNAPVLTFSEPGTQLRRPQCRHERDSKSSRAPSVPVQRKGFR